MANLDKLAIRGIRSFDDKEISVIRFFSPVTVIVGHNGSGKTTIIECLKYATTGDQPPNTRGGAFVHDPKMANEKEVKASVKLRFTAANGTRMLAVRNLNVTVKKSGGLTMKTLESILALADGTEKGGKRGVISTKCAEMDAEIPQLLGVSKAVLENVIFCHQEDSYWPLAEAAALKKKFDDIFEATRYTKALDSIKSLRKDRMADLKAEKERLIGLSKEKIHADKLKSRISEVSASIAAKEVEYEETQKQYEALVEANQKFYDYASKFREIYMKVQQLEENKGKLKNDLEELQLNMQEVAGTDEELQTRLSSFDEHIRTRNQQKRQEDIKKQDLEEDLAKFRKQHTELVAQHGGLLAEAEAQQAKLGDREQLIREIGGKHGIKGYGSEPLEREQVVDFLARLGDAQRQQRSELEQLQNLLRTKTEEYTKKQRVLDNELGRLKLEKGNFRQQIAERQSSIASAERTLENQLDLSGQLQTLQNDIEDRKTRLAKLKSEIAAAQYDTRLNERTTKGRLLEEQREQLNAEIRSLSLQSDARAKLNLTRSDIRNKKAEISQVLQLVNTKFRRLVTGKESTEDSIERDVSRLSIEKEERCSELENISMVANNSLQKAEGLLSNKKADVKAKKDEIAKLERRLKDGLAQCTATFNTVHAAIEDAKSQVLLAKDELAGHEGNKTVYQSLLRVGEQKQLCQVCNRHLDDEEFAVFEKYLREKMKTSSPDKIEARKEELAGWQAELDRLQDKVKPIQLSIDQKKEELLMLENGVEEQEDDYSTLSRKTDEATSNLDAVKRDLKEVSALKEYAKTVVRLRGEVARAEDDVLNLESDLSSTGSTKTADDVQAELDKISANLRLVEREKQNLTSERERQRDTVRTMENNLHSMELKERDLRNEIREKEALEQRMETMKKDIQTFSIRLQDLELNISEARRPITDLEEASVKMQNEMNLQIVEAQRVTQDLNLNVDKLAVVNKAIERYVKDRRGRKLEECSQNIEGHDAKIKALDKEIDAIRSSISEIEKEVSASGASVANLRDNLRARKLTRDIMATENDIASHDMEEIAKAKRTFEQKYNKAKEKENDLHTSYSHLAGEVSSLKTQLRNLESDLKEFKDIYKRYTEQLIQVKMSDMANNDLEKYAKALDNAIMKYHSLKMEEVNDTMKHLWNKTYQGTDIDGIRIVSDVEGGASKRSYNYRVVMTKDQVEMDMRGRCSAGQKMLASIIIRLALSDSFGQNCGILALDEPTNALDTENIDALAASLVDIINERKSHSNFQLIIITHDENFLRKLGQSDVMENYWRVSRDSRQKSIIECQRFR